MFGGETLCPKSDIERNMKKSGLTHMLNKSDRNWVFVDVFVVSADRLDFPPAL